MLLQLKLLQRLGYFFVLTTVPKVIIEDICSRAQVRMPSKDAIARYVHAGTRYRHQALLRKYVKIKQMDKVAEKWLQEQALQAELIKQELPDIINVLIEELIQRRYELPGFTSPFRLARTSRATVNYRIYKAVASSLPAQIIERLDGILQSAHGRSANPSSPMCGR